MPALRPRTLAHLVAEVVGFRRLPHLYARPRAKPWEADGVVCCGQPNLTTLDEHVVKSHKAVRVHTGETCAALDSGDRLVHVNECRINVESL